VRKERKEGGREGGREGETRFESVKTIDGRDAFLPPSLPPSLPSSLPGVQLKLEFGPLDLGEEPALVLVVKGGVPREGGREGGKVRAGI